MAFKKANINLQGAKKQPLQANVFDSGEDCHAVSDFRLLHEKNVKVWIF